MKIEGFDAAKEIKQSHPDLPIIAFSNINKEYAFSFNEKDIQADEFINKPVDIEELISLIQKHLKK